MGHTLAQISPSQLQFGEKIVDFDLLRLQRAFLACQPALESDNLGMRDREWRVIEDGTQERFFGDLFEIGESQLGEEFLVDMSLLVMPVHRMKLNECIPCNVPARLLDQQDMHHRAICLRYRTLGFPRSHCHRPSGQPVAR